MTRVKICGVRDVETLQLLAALNVDYVGFVFAPSRRQVTPQQVQELLVRVPDHPPAVGVFVDPTREELAHVFACAPLQVVQLHGEFSGDFLAEVRSRYNAAIWKVISVKDSASVAVEVNRYRPHVDAFLFDTYDPNLAGGTGRRFSWERIPELAALVGGTPFFVAGGLNSENVGELFATYAPPGLDVSSGVETDGAKDAQKIRTFVERVREYEQSDSRQ